VRPVFRPHDAHDGGKLHHHLQGRRNAERRGPERISAPPSGVLSPFLADPPAAAQAGRGSGSGEEADSGRNSLKRSFVRFSSFQKASSFFFLS